MSKGTNHLHESRNALQVWAIKCSDDSTASDEEYYLRDNWGSFFNTAVLGDTVYVECEGDEINKMTPEKIEKIVRDWFPNAEIKKIVAPKEVVALFSEQFESKQQEAQEAQIKDVLTELAYKIESIVDNSPDYVCCYYDGRHAEPELNVNGSAIIIGGSDTAYSVDSQIDDWISDIQTDIDAGDVTENDMFTSISLGIPYKEDSKDYTAGKDMPTKEEWDTIKRLFDPQDYDPHSDVASVDLGTLDEIRKWIDNH